MFLYCTSSTLSLASICLPLPRGLIHWVAVISISISLQFHYGNMQPGGAERLQSEEDPVSAAPGDESGETKGKKNPKSSAIKLNA